MGVVSVEIGRRREMAEQRGFRRSAERKEEASRDRAIPTVVLRDGG